MAVIANWGADTVLTLVEPEELRELGCQGLSDALRKSEIRWHHFPVPDLGVPATGTLSRWEGISTDLHRVLDAGGRVLVHCRGGLGRAGTMAALLLVERGDTASEAMRLVRAARPGAIETTVQEKFLADRAALPDLRAERIRAAFFGGAIGDALGAEIEFWSLPRILSKFPDGVDRMLPHDGRSGAITDDTQMTLFTAEGLIRAAIRSTSKGICHPPGVVHHALLRWLVTQGYRPKREVDNRGLVADRRLHRRRAPGNTCLGALTAETPLGEPARNDSRGCGTIMRVAPVGLFGGHDVAELAMTTSALTHGHRTGQEAAAAWALILNDVLDGATPEGAARAVLDRFGSETRHALEAALDAPRDGRPETVAGLGEGWIAEEALAIALYSALASSSFEEGLRIAVTHGGDSDSTGAIVSGLLGLMHPAEAMAHPWRREIECADLIDTLARDLDRTARGILPDREEFERLEERYPGW